MDTYAMAPGGKGGSTVQVRYPNGAIIFHLFDTEAGAVAWVVERRKISDAIERFTSAPLGRISSEGHMWGCPQAED
jgi:hypothetical protein